MKDVTFLRSVALLAEFTDEELGALAERLAESTFEEGSIILEEGTWNRALHIVRDGRVRGSRRVDATEVMLCDLEVGPTVGESPARESGPDTTRPRALPPSFPARIALVALRFDCFVSTLAVNASLKS